MSRGGLRGGGRPRGALGWRQKSARLTAERYLGLGLSAGTMATDLLREKVDPRVFALALSYYDHLQRLELADEEAAPHGA